MIAKSVGMVWITRYPWPIENKFYQGRELIIHEFKNILIETKYGIKPKPFPPSNPQANTIIERNHQLLGNLV